MSKPKQFDLLKKTRNLGTVGFATDSNLKLASLLFDKVIHITDFKAAYGDTAIMKT